MTRVVLTQPAPRVARLVDRLRARRHEVLALGQRRLLRCEDAPAPAALIDTIAAGYDWVVFVSPGAIGFALDGLTEPAACWPRTAGVAVVGPGSGQALAERGIAPPEVRLALPGSAPYDAAALLGTSPFDRPAGLRVLVVHGERGRTDWIDTLRARGASVDRLRLYRSEAALPDPVAVARLCEWAGEDAAVVFVFTSAQAVHDCEALLAARGLAGWAHGQRALAVHPRILDVLGQCGWQALELIEPGEQALAAGIESA